MSDAALEEFWQRAMSAIKGRVIQPTLWRAIEQLRPLTVEDNILVLGLTTENSYHASQLASVDRRNAIETVLSELTGQRMSFRVIEGDSLEDWEYQKRRENIVRTQEQAKRQVRDETRRVEDAWEAVSDEIYRIYGQVPSRQFPQNKAAFVLAAIPLLAEAVRRYLTGEHAKNEINQRACARLIEKVATLSDLPPTWIAYEVMRVAQIPRN